MQKLFTTDTLWAFSVLNLLLLALLYRGCRGWPRQVVLFFYAFGLGIWGVILLQQMSPSGVFAWKPHPAGQPAPWIATMVAFPLTALLVYFTVRNRSK